jgi:hypothetical protein
MKTLTRVIIALGMIALAGCSQPEYPAPDTQAGDTAELAEGPEHGVVADLPRAWAVPGEPDPFAVPLKVNWQSKLQKWWKEIWAKIQGKEDPAPAPVPVPTPTPTPSPTPTPDVPASNTFLWKPVADNGGKLVILLPANINATTCTVNGEGPAAYTGRGNGNRQHFRFRKKGADYGANVQVIATLSGGGTRAWTVPNGGTRWSSN